PLRREEPLLPALNLLLRGIAVSFPEEMDGQACVVLVVADWFQAVLAVAGRVVRLLLDPVGRDARLQLAELDDLSLVLGPHPQTGPEEPQADRQRCPEQ